LTEAQAAEAIAPDATTAMSNEMSAKMSLSRRFGNTCAAADTQHLLLLYMSKFLKYLRYLRKRDYISAVKDFACKKGNRRPRSAFLLEAGYSARASADYQAMMDEFNLLFPRVEVAASMEDRALVANESWLPAAITASRRSTS
jgi:hypothetical protein